MDKVVMTSEDIERLLTWRDQHKAEVRSNPAPMKAVEIDLPESGFVIKGIRDGDRLSLYLSKNGRSLGHRELRYRLDGLMASEKNRMKVTEEEFQSVLTVYSSLMALMTYSPVVERTTERVAKTVGSGAKKRLSKKPSARTTYIIRTVNGTLLAAPRGFHASPKGTFNVRGHYRHYKSGKVVWIAEYRKGSGDKKKKTYKIGGKNNEAVQAKDGR